MIDLYYWTTPNGHKLTMFLEEAGLPYRIVPIHIGQGDQFKPEFLKIAPNNRIPAIVDQAPVDGGEPIALFESGAILLYLADKIGAFVPTDLRGRNEALQWLFWQMGGLGPMAGQNHHFNLYAPEKLPYAMLDKHLAGREFIAGSYSIADMACYPWIVPHERQQQNLADFPNLQRWFHAIAARPATQRAYALVEQVNPGSVPSVTEASRKVLFGQDASTVQR